MNDPFSGFLPSELRQVDARRRGLDLAVQIALKDGLPKRPEWTDILGDAATFAQFLLGGEALGRTTSLAAAAASVLPDDSPGEGATRPTPLPVDGNGNTLRKRVVTATADGILAELPETLPLVAAIFDRGLAPSRGEARGLIRGGSVSVNGSRVADEGAICAHSDVIEISPLRSGVGNPAKVVGQGHGAVIAAPPGGA